MSPTLLGLLRATPAFVLLLAVTACDGDAPPPERDAGPVAADAGTASCFPLSGPSADVPDAIPATLTASSSTWMRPIGETCPATGLGAEAVPYESVCYVNDTGADLGVTFEFLTDGDIKPSAVIYDGEAFPTDPTACAAVSSDLVIDVADAYHVVPAGASITLVGTIQEPGTGDVQLVITPD